MLAAENRSFYSDPGISFTGIVRATWNNLTGGSTQGGSTITQQYVKNAILQNSDQTFSRKFQELFLAIKLDNNYSKDQILENYLNTIYYGRGAYGIESAANTYFGVPAAQLTAQQGAVLAVLIRSPSANDPEVDPGGRPGPLGPGARRDGRGGLADRRGAGRLGVPAGAAEGRLVARHPVRPRGPHRPAGDRTSWSGTSYSEQQIDAGGLRITTTVNKAYQDAAVAAVNEVMAGRAGEPARGAGRGRPEDRRRSSPTTAAPSAPSIDYARAQRQPGSSMKPYVLATALEQGIGVEARRDGSSPQTFQDRDDRRCVNSGGASCPAVHPDGGHHPVAEHHVLRPGLRGRPGEGAARSRCAATGLPETWQSGDLAEQDHAGQQRRASPARRSASASTRCARSTRRSASPPSPPAASSATRTSSPGSPTARARCCSRTRARPGSR